MKHLITYFLLFLITSCRSDIETISPNMQFSDHKVVTVKAGDSFSLEILNRLPGAKFQIEYNQTNMSLLNSNSSTLEFYAKKESQNIIYLMNQGRKADSCKINIARPNLIKVLAIGNSFSEDAVEQYLHELFAANGQDVIIGNAMISGCSLATHLSNAKNNLPAYSYRKIDIHGTKSTVNQQTLGSILADENWDYISLQQVSQDSGLPSTFTDPLPELYKFVYKNGTKVLLHQTWAYSPNSTHPGFANYHYNQTEMYNAICTAYTYATSLIPAYKVIPSGTALQNVRTTLSGTDLTRDGYHLSYDLGRFAAACTWYETLSEKNVTQNSYIPSNISNTNSIIIKKAAYLATVSPFKITSP
ncbi:DUF4886 domain-containing protein [Chryseobacterium taklimakanense]|uniref:DUF4886 domain-containing protein n=1 Tax=Chryseobacterium taklimakanense TaxID=536441 RepID=UPI001E3D7D94|nr:DUF4886 domain-containing protein [Chryseobacterium taklimakanense]